MSKKGDNTILAERRESLDREVLDRRLKLQALDDMFADSEDNPYKFLQRWVNPLTSAGMSLDEALAFLIESQIHPN